VNLETGETQWNRPVDYESDDEIERRVETSEMCFDPDRTVKEILVELGAVAEGAARGASISMVTDREEMLDAAEDKNDRCARRLRQIFLAVKYCGGPEEWEAIVQENEYDFVKNIFNHWDGEGRTPPEVRALTCILLDTFMKLDPTLIHFYVSGEWGLDTEAFLSNLELGLQEAVPNDSSLFSWLSLMYIFLTEVPSLAEGALPDSQTAGLLARCMSAKEEDVFLIATYVLLALNSHYGYTADRPLVEDIETGDEDLTVTAHDTPNIVIQTLQQERANGELFSEATLHLLNSQSYPYEDPVLLGQLLYFIRSIFSCVETSSFYHTNDLKVMIDIIISQIQDLPLDEEFRGDYLRVLHLIILNSKRWRGYRRKDVVDVLDFVVENEVRGMHPLACKFSLHILRDCQEQLI